MALAIGIWYVEGMPRKAMPRLAVSPTPITAYLDKHPDANLMSLAKASGLHYDTVVKAEMGLAPPALVTVFKLARVGIPVGAWAETAAVKRQLQANTDPDLYAEKQRRWREKRA
jgi:hypothetical protein